MTTRKTYDKGSFFCGGVRGQKLLKCIFILMTLVFCNDSFALRPNRPLRESIAPYLSGDTFRSIADFAHDEMARCVPQIVSPGSIIFVKGDLLGEFFEKIHPEILHPYIILCHNSDDSAPGVYGKYLDDDKILAFFAQNQDETVHPKLHPLPIGIENRHWKPMNKEVLQRVKSEGLVKKYLLYSNFNIDTFREERALVYQLFQHAPYAYTSPTRKGYDHFIEDLASSKFVLSPRGNGLDTHRLWEALYVGSYPIVKSSSLDSLYDGLPVVIVKDWNEVTQEFLNQKYEELQQKTFSMEKLYTDFWFNWIRSYKFSIH